MLPTPVGPPKPCKRCGETKPDTVEFWGVKMVMANRGDVVEHKTLRGTPMKRVTLDVCRACTLAKQKSYWHRKMEEREAYAKHQVDQILEAKRLYTERQKAAAEEQAKLDAMAVGASEGMREVDHVPSDREEDNPFGV